MKNEIDFQLENIYEIRKHIILQSVNSWYKNQYEAEFYNGNYNENYN